MFDNGAIPIKDMIYEIRGQKVMLDADLAKIYQVETKVFNQAVKRNIDRFPDDGLYPRRYTKLSNFT